MMQVVSRRFSRLGNHYLYAFFTVALFFACGGKVYAGTPTFSSSFSPSTIAPNATSTLTYTIDNTSNDTPVSSVSFSNNLPANVILASVVNASDSCGGVLTAVGGGSSISYSLDRLGIGTVCEISVDVTSSVAGTYVNTTGDLTSSGGNSGSTSSNLTVESPEVVFSVSLTPSSILSRGLSRVSFEINNTANASNIIATSFRATLPTGVVVSSQPNSANDCGGVLDVSGSTINTSNISVVAGASCAISVDITAENVGTYSISPSDLTYYKQGTFTPNTVSAGSAALIVEPTFLNATFPASALPGTSVAFTLTLLNSNRNQTITDLNFTSDLNATLSGLAVSQLPGDGFCGAGSAATGSSTLSIAGVSLASGESCTFEVSVLIPANAAAGSYANTTSVISYNLDGSPTTSPAVTSTLNIYNAPTVAMEFLNDTVTLGSDLTTRFTVTNTDTVNNLSAGSLQLEQSAFVSGTVIKTLPAANSCGSGSTFTQIFVNDAFAFTMSGASLAAGSSCTFDVVFTLPSSGAPGEYVFTSNAVSGTVDGQQLFGNSASDTLTLNTAPALSIALSSSSVLPDDNVTATFTLNYGNNAAADVTAVGFSADLNSALAGLVSESLPQNDICGTGSSLSGTSTVTFAGGTLAPGDSCSFSVSLKVPSSAPSGTITLTSSGVSGTVSSNAVVNAAVSKDLLISGLTATKIFLTDPVLPGSTSTLRYTLSNSASAGAASSISFTDNLSSVISGLQSSGPLPANPCGVSSSISGTSFLIFTGGELQPAESCTFDVLVTVPAGASVGTYNSVSSDVSATVDSANTTAGNMSTTLTVETLTVNLSTTASNPTSLNPIPVDVFFSRDVVGFDIADLSISNGSASNLQGSGSTYSLDITPSSDGAVSVDLPENAVDDAVDSSVKNPAANTLTFTYESTPTVADPSIVIASPSVSATASASVTYAVTYSDVTQVNLTTSAITLNKTGTADATVTVEDGDTTTAIVTLSNITGDGTLGISIGDNTARNVTKLAGSVGPSATFTVDNTQPTLLITSSLTDSIFNDSSFTATFTFSEDVAGFTEQDISLGNANVSNFSAVSTTEYTATITPIADGTVTIDVAAGVTADSVNNTNVGATQFSSTYDATAPTLAITSSISGSATNNVFTATFTFNEDVLGFAEADISVSNASLSGFTSVSASVYSAVITPSVDGTVTLSVNSGVAQDAAGNNNVAATPFVTTFDTISPSVAITSNISGATTNGAFTATFTFSEDVAGFTAADVATNNANVSNFSATSASVYTATITPISDGTVTVDVPANAAQDTAGNNSTAATQFSTSFDGTAPSVAITSNLSGATTNGAFTATFTFSEDVTGFTAADVATNNANVSNFSATSASVYTATITPSSDGTVTVDVPSNAAQDAAGNSSTAATQFTTNFDGTAPSVTITSDITGSATNAAFIATFTFSEAVTGFAASDIAATNANVSNFSATSSSVYTATITPISDGTLTVDVPANAAQDAAGNNSTAATQFSTSFDGTAPSVAITSNLSGATTNGAFTATFTFSEDVTGFAAASIATNAGVSNFAASSASVYTATITPSSDGTVTVDVPANAAQDAAGNGSTAATQFSTSFDGTAPSVTITSDTAGSSTNAAFIATFTFSEEVTGFTAADVATNNANVSNFSATSALVYTATITPSSDGTVTVDVPANAAQDAAGNNSTAATQFSTSFDATAPSVIITSDVAGSITNGAFTATFTFSEDVTGFTAADVATINANVSNFSATSALVYTATITPSSDGTVTVDVPANAAQDAAGNSSTAATQFTTNFDGTAPSVTITSDTAGSSTNAAFIATFTFSEDVTGFTAADVATNNANVSNFSATSALVYTATITPISDGTVTVDVPANAAQDAAGNNSTAATQFSTSFDATAPSVIITSDVAGSITNGAFTATFTFSEDVTGFTAADVATINANVSNFSATSALVYTATITPSSDGTVTVDVPANVAQDLAGNNNTAAEQFTIENDGSTPSVTITANTIAEVINSEFTATFTFSEDVTGFEPLNISASNASVSAFRVVSASVYTALISPVNDGEVTINVAADAAEDSAGNGNSAAVTFTLNYDAKAPTLISSTPQNNANNVAVSRLTVELRFDEAVDIVGGNIQLINVGSDQLVETLSLLGNSVTKVSSIITINFASLLEENQQYRLIVDNDSVIDIAGNAWQGLSDDSLIFITANEPPSANNDEATIDEDSEIAIDVLVNDRDGEDDLDVASLSIDTAPLNGTAIVNTQTGIITYTPTANFNGSDSFTYTVADTQGSVSDPTTVAITVNPINDAPVAANDAVSIEEEQQLAITILENDTDVDESSNLESNIIDPTSIVIEVQPGSGEVTIVDEATAQENSELQVGQVIYIPDVNFFGADTFSYTVKDTLGAVSNTATVTVSVGGVNDAPVAHDDSATTNEDESVVIAVTANDTDSEGEIDTQSVTIAQQGQLGNATVDGNTGEITYTPNLNKFGTDTLRYSVKDSEGLLSNLATVTIEILPVNDAPQAADDSFTLSMRSPSILNVTDNDLDPDSAEQPANKIDIESVTVLSPAEYGEIEVDTQTGSLIYTPFDTALDETDTFTYQVADTEGALSNVATVSVALQLQSTGVVANDDNAETQEDNAVAVNVLANDGDPTRVLNPASINVVVPATNGMAQAGADGLITYTPNENFFGEDSFTYTVKDTSGDTSNAALVSVSVAPVNDAPTIAGTPITSIISGNIYQFKPSASDVDSSVLTFSVENKPVWGAFDASTGELTGTPAETDAGLYENILITVSDEEGLSARLSSFSIEVISTASLTPTAFNTSVQAIEDESVSISAQATDPNNLPLVYEIVQQPQSGVLSGSLPNVTYTPNANYFGTDSFEFTVSNGEYTSAPATIAINIKAVNDAPIATDDEATVEQGQSVVISALENDSDVEDESLTIVQATVSQGTVEISNDELNYSSPSNFTGVAIINYTVADSERLTASAQVLVTVTASNGGNSTITLSVPEEVNVNATGLITHVALGQATATDNFNNTIPVSLQTPPFFTPGKHTVVWQAQKGEEVQQESQLVTVYPMVSIEAAQRVEEGRQATINVFLNGEAPLYPINIPYTVSGTSDINDHNLSSGTLVIESGTSASLTVDTKADAIIEGEETLVVTLQPSLNVGNAQHILTIVEGSVEPELALSAVQSNVQVTTIYPQLGTVDVTLSIANKEIDDIDYIDWSGTSSELTALDVSTSDTVFSFSPSSLNAGLYHVRVEVADKAGLVSVAEIALVLDLVPPQLIDEDSDGDGVPDSQEGYGDDDGDGIANYLDAVGACNVQPTGTANAPNFFIEGDAGGCLRIGDTAASNRANGVVVEESSVPSDEGFTSIGNTIDFVISGLPNKGASYRLVIPQQNVIPSNARYRKYNAAQMSWNEFVVDGSSDSIYSAKGEQGVCPAPSSAAWTEGLNAGDWCVRLTISDGGPNDDDGIANGSIADPSRLAIVTSDNTKPVANEDTLTINTGDNGVLNVLENDTDADGDVLSIVSVNAYLGEVSLENNNIVYTSPDNFSGSDTVVYSISDGKGGVDSTLANVLANVNNVPEAQNDLAETDNETAVTIDVLANDSDADGDMLTIASAQTDTGTVDIVDNQLVFTPQPESIGLATITYRVEDEKGSVDEANVRVTVSAKANEPPQAQNDSASTDENTAVTVNVLANDSDPDGDELSIVSATASDGAVSIQGGNLVFTPSTGFIGTAIVDYTITDGVNEASAVLTVRVIKPVSKSSGGSMSLGLMLILFMLLLYRMLDGRGCKRMWLNIRT